MGVHPKNERKPVKGFRHEWDVIPHTFFKDVSVCSVENEPEGAGGKVGKTPGDRWGPGEARRRLAVLQGQQE